MTTTFTPAAPAAAGWVIPTDQLAWDRDDWLDAYSDDSYASSVIWASDDNCLLLTTDLERLLRHHHTTVAELQDELTAGQQLGAAVLPITHAAQALAWLGY